jgi:ankyrin repeat protein
MVRSLLSWAVLHDQRRRVGLLAEHGVDIVAPFAAGYAWAAGETPIEVAVANGHSDLARLLRQLGAPEPALSSVEEFVGAVLAGDESAIERTPSQVRAEAQRTRPGLIVWAAGQQRLSAVNQLARAGWNVNAFGRSDIPAEQPWHTALHAAVEQADPALVRRLLELGADRELRDARFDATPADWAEHLGRDDLVPLLRP